MFIYLLRHAVAVEPAEAKTPAHDQPQAKAALPANAPNETKPAAKEGADAKSPHDAKPLPNEGREATMAGEDRPLTKDGRKKMMAAAQGIDRIIPAPIDVILTSPLLRARETAQIAAEVMGIKKKVKLCPELLPGISYSRLLKALAKYKSSERIMLVGHSPDLNAAASALLGSDAVSVELKKGAVCCIEIASLSGRTKGTLVWLMQPKQLRQLAK